MDEISSVSHRHKIGSNSLMRSGTITAIGGIAACQSSKFWTFVVSVAGGTATAAGGQASDVWFSGQKAGGSPPVGTLGVRRNRPATDRAPMINSSGDNPTTIGAGAGGLEQPTESSGWILSGFDSNGMAVRLNLSELDLRADPDGLIVGRSARKAKLILKDDSVSRAHARITLDDHLTVEDLQSSNGTTVNGRTLEVGERVHIEQGVAIEFGAVRLTLTRS